MLNEANLEQSHFPEPARSAAGGQRYAGHAELPNDSTGSGDGEPPDVRGGASEPHPTREGSSRNVAWQAAETSYPPCVLCGDTQAGERCGMSYQDAAGDYHHACGDCFTFRRCRAARMLERAARAPRRSLRFLPIIPRNGMYLTCYGQGTDARLARIFRDTWPRVPAGARRALLAHWRNSVLPHSPRIEQVWDLEALTEDDTYTRALGACGMNGHLFQFSADAVQFMPPRCVGTLIAHELGHGFARATGLPFCNEDEEEVYVRRSLVPSWGFDEAVIDRWVRQQRRMPPGEGWVP